MKLIGLVVLVVLAVVIGWVALMHGPMPISGTQSTSSPPSGGYGRLLQTVPKTSDAGTLIQLDDFTRAEAVLSAIGGPSKPGAQADDTAVQGYAAQLSTRLEMVSGPAISGFDALSLSHMAYLKANAGYDLRDVAATVVAGAPPNEYHAMAMRSPTQPIYNKLAGSGDLPPTVNERYHGVPTLSWGADYKADFGKRLQLPAYDELGRGARLAFLDGLILDTVWTDGLHLMVDAAQGQTPSLNDQPGYRALADGADRLGLYSVLIADEASVAPMQTASSVALRPYQVVASGIGHGNGGFFIGLMLYHGTAADASANASRLRAKLSTETNPTTGEPWSQLIDLSASSITTDGPLLVAKLPLAGGKASSLWSDLIIRRDPLLAHE